MRFAYSFVLFFMWPQRCLQDFCNPIGQRLQALTSYSFKIRGLPPSLLGKTPAGEAPLATLLDRLRGVRFLVLDSLPISDSIMSYPVFILLLILFSLILHIFLYHNFENLDSLSVSGCKDITFVVPTSANFNKSNSRTILQPPIILPADNSETRTESEYDLRSLTSSTSSAVYTFDEGSLIPNPDSTLRSPTPVPEYDDNSSDFSSPPISPRNSFNLQDFILRGGTPPPELRIGEASPSRSSVHSGIRSNSDGSSVVTPIKLKRSSSTTDTPQSVASGTVAKRSGSESSGSSPTTPHFIRSGSIGGDAKVAGRVTLALGRSGSGDFTINNPGISSINNASPPNVSPSINLTESNFSTSPNTATTTSGSPGLSRNSKRLNMIGIGRSNAETPSSSESSSPRSRNSLKMFGLSKSGGEISAELNTNSSPANKLTHSGGSGGDSTPRLKNESKGLRFAELQFLNCSNCTSLLDKSLQALALQKLPLQCLYLGMVTDYLLS